MKIFKCIDIGRYRENQEDALHIGKDLYVISDGMGGHASGELASAAVISELVKLDEKLLNPEKLKAAVVSADKLNSKAGDGRGATCVLAHIAGNKAYCLNVGDSRLYHVQDGKLNQVTQDQGVGHILRSFVGGSPFFNDDGKVAFNIDQYQFTFNSGDSIMLCSDGISDYLPAHRILKILQNTNQGVDPAEELVSAALDQGSRDNCTAIVIRS